MALEHRDEYLMRKYFDLDLKYGPCISVSRKERWLRAAAFACDPPLFVWSLICKYDETPFLLRPSTSMPLPRFEVMPFVDSNNTSNTTASNAPSFAMDVDGGGDVRGDNQQLNHGFSLWESI